MDNTKCYEYPEHNEKNNFIIEKQYESNPKVNIYRYNRTYMSYLNLYFCIINFKETMFISVTDDNNQMNDLQVSYPIKYEDADNTICLVGEPHSYGNDIARLLGMKFKMPFFVSVNVDECDENLTNFIFLNCLEILKVLLKNKEENKVQA
ncbi:hypothetical protein PFHG_01267 [Plasmodium falciparum HB3]|uniref:Proteasome assembly chaperone 4 n=1 Tax=Plasmodium falciparum (isolate HB3) TaxID=137071 RepID=A0A0L7K8S3_PLAFX|nr:hypothetical protein PFHG_01267 [Plasmodium falciparum HB3]